MMKNDRFTIRDVRRKIAAGERRARYVESQFGQGAPSSETYAREELLFIEAAILTLKYYELSLSPETSIPLALRELLEEMDRVDMPGQNPAHDKLQRAYIKARRILREWSE